MRRIFVIFILLFMPLAAQASEWQVLKVSQPTQYTQDNRTWAPLAAGMIVPDKAWINTGPRGRVVLGHGTERIVLQPNSLASLIASSGGKTTNVAQQFGVVELDVETKSYQHVSVQTPFLAAVVKGTKFTVTVSDTAATVAVKRGLVEVTATEQGKRSYVGVGQTAHFDKVRGFSVSGKGKKTIQSVAAKRAKVPAVSAKTLSNLGVSAADIAPDLDRNTVGSTSSDSTAADVDSTSAGEDNGVDNSDSNGTEDGAGNKDNTGQGKGDDGGDDNNDGDSDGDPNGHDNHDGHGRGHGDHNGHGRGHGDHNGHGKGHGDHNGHGKGHGKGRGKGHAAANSKKVL